MKQRRFYFGNYIIKNVVFMLCLLYNILEYENRSGSEFVYYIYYWILLGVGILATVAFLAIRVKKGGIIALYAKAVASCCFIATAIAATNQNRIFIEFGSLMISGLILGMLGDIWLDLKWIYLQDKDLYLYSGFISFLLGHVCFVTAIFRNSPWELWSTAVAVIAAVVIAVIALLMEKPLKMHYGRFKLIVFLYSFMLALTMTSAIMTAVITNFKPVWVVMSIGGILFLLSDLVLSGMYFAQGKNTKVNIIINHSLYYAAQFFMAATILFIK